MLDFNVQTQDAAAAFAEDAKRLAKASRFAIEESVEITKDRVRQEVRGGLDLKSGAGFIRGYIWEDGPGDVAGMVANTWRKGSGDPLVPHLEGATIRPKGGGFLFWPAPGKSWRQAKNALDQLNDKSNLVMVPQGNGNFIFIRRTSSRRTTLIGFFRKKVQVPQSLSFEPIVQRGYDLLERTLAEQIAPSSS